MSSDEVAAIPVQPAPTVVVFAPVAGDGESLRALLEEEGLDISLCADAAAFYASLDQRAWCAIVTEEGLDACSLEGLDSTLRRQSAWSDLPLLTLAGQTRATVDSNRFVRLARMGNVTLIERPTSREILLMSVRSALRTRRLQFAMRDHWHALERHAGELENAVRDRTDKLEREIGERRRVEHALAEARRLESLGRLTGGVAHDFNNLLQVISGSETLLRILFQKEDNPRLDRALDNIRRASGHGAALTQQLLAYARRQPLNNVSLDLGQYLHVAGDMLAGAAGSGVRLAIDAERALWPVFADPAQLDAALLNIVGNARDAMPEGGSLAMRVWNVVLPDPALPEGARLAGEFVCLMLTDDGEGMSEKTARHAFDPFFTTKLVGKGAGLGLSQVDGFASQSQGLAFIRRERMGTTIGLLLPRGRHAAPAAPATPAPYAQSSLQGVHILCVEDDPGVAETSASLLQALEAEITVVDSADAALAADLDGIDLVLSDVMMPGSMDGIGLVHWLASRYPDLPVVLTSGYMVDPGRLQTLQVEFVRKPYAVETLVNAIVGALGRAPAGMPAP